MIHSMLYIASGSMCPELCMRDAWVKLYAKLSAQRSTQLLHLAKFTSGSNAWVPAKEMLMPSIWASRQGSNTNEGGIEPANVVTKHRNLREGQNVCLCVCASNTTVLKVESQEAVGRKTRPAG